MKCGGLGDMSCETGIRHFQLPDFDKNTKTFQIRWHDLIMMFRGVSLVEKWIKKNLGIAVYIWISVLIFRLIFSIWGNFQTEKQALQKSKLRIRKGLLSTATWGKQADHHYAQTTTRCSSERNGANPAKKSPKTRSAKGGAWKQQLGLMKITEECQARKASIHANQLPISGCYNVICEVNCWCHFRPSDRHFAPHWINLKG